MRFAVAVATTISINAPALHGQAVRNEPSQIVVIDGNEIVSVRRSATAHTMEAMQSYPTLLGAGGTAPSLVCDPRSSDALLDHGQRDARLAIGTTADGRLVIAMTRYSGVGTLAERLPIGPTTPEMAEIMRRLGATRALMLDGGLSAQMHVRETARGTTSRWSGLRDVPLALVGRSK